MKNLKNVLVIAFVGAALVSGCAKFGVQTASQNEYTKNGCSIADAKQPENEAEYVKQGDQHFKRSEYQCQFFACDYAISLTSQDAEAFSCRALAYRYMEHDLVHGAADLTTAIQLRPDADYGNYYSDRGNIYEAGSQFDLALADYQKALELATVPTLKAYAKSDMAGLYLKKGNTDLALSAANDAVQLSPDIESLYRHRADIYIKIGKFDLAVADLKKSSELDAKKSK